MSGQIRSCYTSQLMLKLQIRILSQKTLVERIWREDDQSPGKQREHFLGHALPKFSSSTQQRGWRPLCRKDQTVSPGGQGRDSACRRSHISRLKFPNPCSVSTGEIREFDYLNEVLTASLITCQRTTQGVWKTKSAKIPVVDTCLAGSRRYFSS